MKKYIENSANVKDRNSILQKLTDSYQNEAESFKTGGVVVSSNHHEMSIVGEDVHSLVMGSTGAMKTRRVGMPTLVSMIKAEESFVINDCKKEYYPLVKNLLMDKDYKIIILNARDNGVGNRYNPLSLATIEAKKGNYSKSSEYIADVAETLFHQLQETTNDIYWGKEAADYFCGLAEFIRDFGNENDLTIENIRHLHNMTSQVRTGKVMMSNYLDQIDKKSSAYSHLASTIYAPTDTRASVFAVFTQPLNFYVSSNNITDFMCESDFDMSKFGIEKTAVFLMFPDEKTTFNPIITLFVKQVYEVLVEEATKYGGKLPRRVNLLLDEFCNLPKINDFNTMISASRSRNIRFHLFIQSYAQLNETYGRNGAENILNNCGIWIVLRSKEYDFSKKISDICGMKELSYSKDKISILTPLDIQTLNKQSGEVYIIWEGNNVFKSKLADISEYDFELFGVDNEIEKRIPVLKSTIDIGEIEKNIKNPMHLHSIILDFDKKEESFAINAKDEKERLRRRLNFLNRQQNSTISKLKELEKKEGECFNEST